MTSKILAAITAALIAGVIVANTAGAAGRPWWCGIHSYSAGLCEAGHTAKETRKTVDEVGRGAGATVEAGQQGGRVVVNGTELAGTILGKVADATKAANEQAKRIPTRTLGPGECVTTTRGRVCRPATPTRVAVGQCVVDSNDTTWCVRR